MWSQTRLGKVSDPFPKLENQVDFTLLPFLGAAMGLVSHCSPDFQAQVALTGTQGSPLTGTSGQPSDWDLREPHSFGSQ